MQFGMTPLALAAANDKTVAVIKFLLEAGCDMEALDQVRQLTFPTLVSSRLLRSAITFFDGLS